MLISVWWFWCFITSICSLIYRYLHTSSGYLVSLMSYSWWLLILILMYLSSCWMRPVNSPCFLHTFFLNMMHVAGEISSTLRLVLNAWPPWKLIDHALLRTELNKLVDKSYWPLLILCLHIYFFCCRCHCVFCYQCGKPMPPGLEEAGEVCQCIDSLHAFMAHHHNWSRATARAPKSAAAEREGQTMCTTYLQYLVWWIVFSFIDRSSRGRRIALVAETKTVGWFMLCCRLADLRRVYAS